MDIRQLFLIAGAIGLVPVALSYGVMPEQSLPFLFDVSVPNTNGRHIFRGVMGLYLGFVLFWTIGALNVRFRQAALYSLIIFMLGLAAGRSLSVIIDGMPHWLLLAYLVAELGLAAAGIFLIRKVDQNS